MNPEPYKNSEGSESNEDKKDPGIKDSGDTGRGSNKKVQEDSEKDPEASKTQGSKKEKKGGPNSKPRGRPALELVKRDKKGIEYYEEKNGPISSYKPPKNLDKLKGFEIYLWKRRKVFKEI